jgi:hypothetical protein
VATNNEVHASWSIHHAVFRATQDGAGLLLEVAAPSATSQALFERILISVRPGQQAGAPGSKRIAYGVAFGVPRAWRVVREHDDPCASGTEAVFLGVDLDKARCTLPRSYLDVSRSKAPTGRLVKLNGFGLQYGLSGQAIGTGRWREEDTADLAVPALRFRMVTVRGQALIAGTARCSTVRSIMYSRVASASTARNAFHGHPAPRALRHVALRTAARRSRTASATSLARCFRSALISLLAVPASPAVAIAVLRFLFLRFLSARDTVGLGWRPRRGRWRRGGRARQAGGRRRDGRVGLGALGRRAPVRPQHRHHQRHHDPRHRHQPQRRPVRLGSARCGRRGPSGERAGEVTAHCLRALVALVGMLGHGGQHHRVHGRADLRVAPRGWLGRLADLP